MPTPSELVNARRIARALGVNVEDLNEHDPRIEMTLIAYRIREHLGALREEIAKHEAAMTEEVAVAA